MNFKVLLLSFLVGAVVARPQTSLDDFNAELENDLGPFNPNPVYNYAYQVSDDEQQTYMAHEEARDGDLVTGQYSYVDANGALVTVVYEAGPNGYTEQRSVQDNFVEIRARPVSVAPVQPVQPVRPAPRPTPAPTPAPRPVVPEPSDDDLVARIIAQLTPFIRDTVSTSLQSGASRTPAPAPVPRPVPVAAPAPRPVPVAQASTVEGIFGTGGANNVRVDTPDFNYAFDLRNGEF